MSADSWTGALRFALATMFIFIALSHFLPRTRGPGPHGPPQLPHPELLVAVTGVLELLGAVGLLIPGLVRISAYALMALLVVLFPANIHAAWQQLVIAGRPATPLVRRLPLLLFWIGVLWRIGHATTAA